jgi:hypothetical protein
MAKANKKTGLTDRELLDKIKTSHEKPEIWTTAHPRSRINFDPKVFVKMWEKNRENYEKRRKSKQGSQRSALVSQEAQWRSKHMGIRHWSTHGGRMANIQSRVHRRGGR